MLSLTIFIISGVYEIFRDESNEEIDNGKSCSNDLELGGDNGRQIIRILLELIMADFPPLVSSALNVFFRLFNQRAELLNALKQIQLLVSQQDVQNYQQVNRDLLLLKNLTEKSELWVYSQRNRNSSLLNGVDHDKGSDEADSVLPKKRSLIRLQSSDSLEAKEEDRKVLMNLFRQLNHDYPLSSEHCYQLLQDLFSNQRDTDVEASWLIDQSHRLNYMIVEQPDAVDTLSAIFNGNRDLCTDVNERLIHHIVQLIERKGRNVSFLRFLQTLLPEDKPIAVTQDKVSQAVK
ncbi:unnamed protein product [Soboliphyme baturini]|uniref:RYDR_ITPR domain-containing protein n=1 Tax=Soboliphyme baturini TaxID=241478 RepID=A0A183IP22_9BILA|nr:unnamed protein product [Soboliphyme baturini]